MEVVRKKVVSMRKYVDTFFKWVIISGITGLIGGLVGSLFHLSVEYSTEFRNNNPNIIYLLPFGGLIIVYLYNLSKSNDEVGTNLVIASVRKDGKVPSTMAPLIFISTVITHLFGGSAGREGAALQLGGSIGSQVGQVFKLDEKDMHLVTLCGMSGVFSALFGTPLTATFFSMEVISVGIIYYSSFIPCIVASIVAYGVSIMFGLEPVRFTLNKIPDVTPDLMIKVVILSALCAVVSIVFCEALHKTNKFFSTRIKNRYMRIFVGGIIVIILTLLVRCRDYNGAGMDIITNAINGDAKIEAFLLKMVFTAITIGVGFKGGEIVPTFFVGATFGCVVGKMIGLDPGIGAAIGLIALFCGVVNTLVSSIILSIELFGSQALLLFSIACGVSYMLSGYYSLYSSQKIIYSKLKAEYINRNAK